MKASFIHFKVKKSSLSQLELELVVSFMRKISGVPDAAFDYSAERTRLHIRDLAMDKAEKKYGQSLAYCNTALHISNGVARISASAKGGRRVVAAFMRIVINESAACWKESLDAASCGPSLMHLAKSRKPTQLELGYRGVSAAKPTPAWRSAWTSPPAALKAPKPEKPTAVRHTVED